MIQFLTAVDLLNEVGHPEYAKYAGLARAEDFYGDLIYQVTYGEQEAELETMIDYMTKNGYKKGGKKVLEVFGGTAFESMLLQKEFKKNEFHSLDNDVYFKGLYKTIKYVYGDVYKKKTLEEGKYDLVFCGATNRSMCVIDSLEKMKLFIANMKYTLKLGGVYAGAFFDSAFEGVDTVSVDSATNEIKYNKKFKGKWCRWGSITRYEAATKRHHYYTIALVSKNEVIESVSDIVAYSYNKAIIPFQSWPFNIVVEMFAEQKMKLIDHDLKSVNPNFVVFQKIS